MELEFQKAIALMESDPKEAAAIFQSLYDLAPTIRIQLELARSLYLAGDLAAAKKQFVVLLDRPIPFTVRDKVEWYLSEIQKRQSAKIVLGFIQDSNPGYVTSARTVSIFGQTLNYQPAQNTNSAPGLQLGAEAEREIIPQSGFYTQLNANTVTYATSAFNKQDVDFSFVKRWQGYDYKDLRAGYETMWYGGAILFNYAYVSSKFVFNLPNQDYYGFLIMGGPLNYPNYSYLSGSQTQGNIFYNRNLTQDWSLYLELGGDQTLASQSAYSSQGLYTTIGTQIADTRSNLQANIKASVLKRNYWESDPFWGQTRKDIGGQYFISITKRDYYILGLRPSIDISYQSNNSNIAFFSYNKLVGGIFFRNVY